jgi:CoA:oxalate CoA-transferase
MKTLPLVGLRVVEVAQLVSGPYCGTLLAQLGATVVKVEPPQGDMARHFAPFVNDDSAYYRSVNRGKDEVRLELGSEQGRARLEDLLADADVLIHNMRPDAARRAGIASEELRVRFPNLIVCSISAYGGGAERRDGVGVDLIFQAESGLMSITGFPDGPPMRAGTNVPDFFSALAAFSGIMVAIHQRQATGRAPRVDISLMEATLALQTCWLAAHSAGGKLSRMGNGSPFTSPTGSFETSDSHVVVSVTNEGQWAKFCGILGRLEMLQDERFSSNENRCQNRAELEGTILPIFRTRSTQDWVQAFKAAGLGAARPADYDEVLVTWADLFQWEDGIAMANLPFRLED